MRGSGSQARLIEDFLKREYGVKGLKIEHRTKHAKLVWQHQGSAYSYMCSRNTSGDGHAALLNAKSNIRRMMRLAPEAPQIEIEEEGAMEDVMEAIREKAILQVQVDAPQPRQPEPEPARVWRVMASAYTNSTCAPAMHFSFPAAITDVLPAFSVERLDAEHWKFRPGRRHWRQVPWSEGARVRTTIAAEDTQPFKAMPVDAIEADQEVLVFVPMADRAPPILKRRSPSKYAVQPPPAPEEEPMPKPQQEIAMHERPVPHPMPPLVEVPQMEFRMRVILEQARELEKQTPYRLTRQDDRLVWQAPTIA